MLSKGGSTGTLEVSHSTTGNYNKVFFFLSDRAPEGVAAAIEQVKGNDPKVHALPAMFPPENLQNQSRSDHSKKKRKERRFTMDYIKP